MTDINQSFDNKIVKSQNTQSVFRKETCEILTKRDTISFARQYNKNNSFLKS